MTPEPDRHLLRELDMYEVPTPIGADAAMAMPVHAAVTNPRGGLQGGLLATLIDVVAGRAAHLRAGPGTSTPTADLHIRYLSPVTAGPAIAVARLVRQGRSQMIYEVTVHDEGRGVLAATATLCFAVLTARAEEQHARPADWIRVAE